MEQAWAWAQRQLRIRTDPNLLIIHSTIEMCWKRARLDVSAPAPAHKIENYFFRLRTVRSLPSTTYSPVMFIRLFPCRMPFLLHQGLHFQCGDECKQQQRKTENRAVHHFAFFFFISFSQKFTSIFRIYSFVLCM